MITQSEDLANQASVQTLTGQAPRRLQRERNALLVDISSATPSRAPRRSRASCVTTPERVPKIVTWRVPPPRARLRLHTGLVRSPSDASNTTRARRAMPPARRRRRQRAHHACCGRLAVRNTTPHDASTSLVPGHRRGHRAPSRHVAGTLCRVATRARPRVLERDRAAHEARRVRRHARRGAHGRGARLRRPARQARGGRVAAARGRADRRAHARRHERRASARARRPGRLRDARGPLGEPLAGRGRAVRHALATTWRSRSRPTSSRACCSSQVPPRRPVPAHLRRALAPPRLARLACEEHDRPQTLLPIVDCKVDFLETTAGPGAAAAQPARRGLRTGGHHAHRVRRRARAPARAARRCSAPTPRCARTTVHATLRSSRAAAGGAARASELNDVANSVSAGHVNSSIASAKRILVGDLNLRLLLTLYQANSFAILNHAHTHTRMEQMRSRARDRSTAWARATCRAPLRRRRGAGPTVSTHCITTMHAQAPVTPYNTHAGAGFDIGTSGGIGIRASSVTADKRCVAAAPHPLTPLNPPSTPSPPHPLTAGTTASCSWRRSRWTSGAELAATHYVPVSDTHYAAIPREAAACPTRHRRGCTPIWTTTPTRMERARSAARHRGPAHGRLAAVPAALALCRAAGARTSAEQAVRSARQTPSPHRPSTPTSAPPPVPRAQTRPCPSASATPTTPWRRGARLPGGRDVRRTWPSCASRSSPCVGDHLAAGLHLWPVAALPDLGPRRRRGAARASRARRTCSRTRSARPRARRGDRTCSTCSSRLTYDARRAAAARAARTHWAARRRAAQLDLHVRPAAWPSGASLDGNALGAGRVRRAHALQAAEGRRPSARRCARLAAAQCAEPASGGRPLRAPQPQTSTRGSR